MNIDGKPLGVDIRYFDGASGAMVQKEVPPEFFPMQDQSWLTDPLNQKFDNIWNHDQNSSGQTLQQQYCALGEQVITNDLNNMGGSSSNMGCAFASTGSLSAKVDGSLLTLDYHLANNSISFFAIPPDCGGAGWAILTLGASCVVTAALSGTYAVSGDVDVLLTTPIPDTPCQLAPTAASRISNLSVPFGIDASAFSSLSLPVSTASFQPLVDSMERSCQTAANDDFNKFDATVDATNGPTFRLIHPEDAKPELAEAVRAPDLTAPTIGLSQSEVKAGGQLTVTGSSFSTPPQTTAVTIWWDDSFNGTFTESDIQWGRKGGTMQPVTIARSPSDNKASWQTPTLKRDTAYRFTVSDCFPAQYKGLTLFTICTPPSDPLDVKPPTSGGSNAVDFYLDSVASANQIGSGTIGTGGTFSSPVTIPAGTTAKQHTLYAQAAGSGQQASADMTVVGASAALTPTIEVIDPSTSAVEPYASQGGSVTLRGAGFAAGTVTVTLGSASGEKLGMVTVKSDGTFQHGFTLPMSANGDTTLVASEDDGGQTLQATTSATVLAAPK